MQAELGSFCKTSLQVALLLSQNRGLTPKLRKLGDVVMGMILCLRPRQHEHSTNIGQARTLMVYAERSRERRREGQVDIGPRGGDMTVPERRASTN